MKIARPKIPKAGLLATAILCCLIESIWCTPLQTPYPPYKHDDASVLSNPTFSQNFRYAETLQKESEWFRRHGDNKYASILNIFLAIEFLLGGIASVVAASTIWGAKSNRKAVMALILSLAISVASASAYLSKAENSRFYESNFHQYAKLSLEIDKALRNFYMDFDKAGFNDLNIDQRKKEFLDLAQACFNKIDQTKADFNEKYEINVNPQIKSNI
jgi:hypothetical protein